MDKNIQLILKSQNINISRKDYEEVVKKWVFISSLKKKINKEKIKERDFPLLYFPKERFDE